MPNGRALQFTFPMGVKSVITSPCGGQRMQGPGLYQISGIAWTGAGRIRRVDVSADGGKTWAPSALSDPVLPKALHAIPHGVAVGRKSRGPDEPGRRRNGRRSDLASGVHRGARARTSLSLSRDRQLECERGWRGAECLLVGLTRLPRVFALAGGAGPACRRHRRRNDCRPTDRARRHDPGKTRPLPRREKPRRKGRDSVCRQPRRRSRLPTSASGQMAPGCRRDPARPHRAKRSTARNASPVTGRKVRGRQRSAGRGAGDAHEPGAHQDDWELLAVCDDRVRLHAARDALSGAALAHRSGGLRVHGVPAQPQRGHRARMPSWTRRRCRRSRCRIFGEPLPVHRSRLLVGGGRGVTLARRNLR